jgi:hypothetical protein
MAVACGVPRYITGGNGFLLATGNEKSLRRESSSPPELRVCKFPATIRSDRRHPSAGVLQ